MNTTLDHLIDQNCQALEDLHRLLAATSEEQYRAPSDPCHHSSIGQQVRHVLEHGEAVLNAATGPVDYHTRSRDPRTERSLSTARERLVTLIRRLDELEGSATDTPLACWHVAESPDGILEDTLHSSLGRELAFLQSHTVHHMALIGIMASLQGISVPTGFGIAPSTRRYWATQEQGRDRLLDATRVQ